jgi:hypothetical protein
LQLVRHFLRAVGVAGSGQYKIGENATGPISASRESGVSIR